MAWFFEVFLHPRAAIADIAARGQVRDGIAAMLVLGVLHAGFSLALYLAGHAPKIGTLGFDRGNHYLVQAVFVLPLYTVLSWIGGRIAHAIALRLLGSGSREASLAVFGVAYALPMIVFFLIPDIFVFGLFGFAAIGKAMRWYAPIAAITCVWLGAVGFSRAHNLTMGRAALAVFIGFVAQVMLGGAFLR